MHTPLIPVSNPSDILRQRLDGDLDREETERKTKKRLFTETAISPKAEALKGRRGLGKTEINPEAPAHFMEASMSRTEKPPAIGASAAGQAINRRTAPNSGFSSQPLLRRTRQIARRPIVYEKQLAFECTPPFHEYRPSLRTPHTRP